MNIIHSGFLTSIPVIVSKRVLAGPHSIQIFGSLGLGIIKIGRFIRGAIREEWHHTICKASMAIPRPKVPIRWMPSKTKYR